MARAYEELEQAGLVSMKRTGGTIVRASQLRTQSQAVGLLAEALIARARQLGASKAPIRTALNAALGTEEP